MKSLGQIYSDSFEGKNKWYHNVWFYLAFIGIFIWLAPPAVWRKITGRKTLSDIEAEKYWKQRDIV